MSDVLEEIYLKHKDAIYSYFFRSTMNRSISEELTQDTFLKAFRFFNNYRGHSSIKTWLYKIARNTFITYLRQKSCKEQPFSVIETKEAKDSIAQLHQQLLIKDVFYKIKEKDRTLIILRDINGLSYKEIAEVMNCTEGQIKVSIHRARKRFREIYYTENGGQYSGT